MKLYNVKNVKGFIETVNDCEGRVDMVLPSKDINLNNADELLEVLDQVAPEEGFREIELKVEKNQDVVRLLKYAMRDFDTRSILAEIREGDAMKRAV
ncbi:MAG: hypothetical protein IJ106_12830 [Parasporobacterium sp.]|nr:hypothetical protein [Parasporobacterium sp.]